MVVVEVVVVVVVVVVVAAPTRVPSEISYQTHLDNLRGG